MKNVFITILLVDKEYHGMFSGLSTISVMMLVLAIILYIFTRKHRREEVRAPLEDDGTVESEANKTDLENLNIDKEPSKQ